MQTHARSFVLLILSVGLLSACGSTPTNYRERDTRGLDRAERSIDARPADQRVARTSPDGRPPLLINQQAVSWDQLSPVMAEATGAAAIEEIALQFALRREFDTRRLRLSEEALRAEQNLLSGSLSSAGSYSEDSTFTVMDDLRSARGLGPVRFRSLLERNAMLRALVQDDILIDEPTLQTAYAIRHGLRRVVRLIVVPTQREASQIRNSLVSLPGEQRRAEFIQAAIEFSTDSTAPRGGLTEPISPQDPAYTQAVRRVLTNLVPGEVSQVVSVDGGYALLLLENDIPPDGLSFEEARPSLERLVRLRQERLLMDRLARNLLAQARITVFDESLHWAWQNRRSN